MIASLIRERAAELGFARVGIVPVGPMRHAGHFRRWLDDGFHGAMSYMEKRAEVRENSALLEPWARTVIAVSAPYAAPGDTHDPAAPWARYALGDDYHEVLWDRLEALAAFVRAETGAELVARPATDSAPVLERNLAVDAGLGWLGKSAMVLDQEWGSYTLLAELFVDVELDPDATERPDRCGTCSDCIDLCPTGAIVAPYRVDARRCISYLTIETRGPIPRPLRAAIGLHVFGCDVCQDVCPWNRKAQRRPMEPLQPRNEISALDAAALLRMDAPRFAEVFRGTAIKRTRRKGLARNAAVALGNTGDRTWVGELVSALREHDEPLVRGHAAWALGALGGGLARLSLELQIGCERSPYVREEIRAALEAL